MGEYKTPGVYIKEKNAFGNSIVEAETAIPVFIGLTEKAQDGTESLQNKPVRISSMTEYIKYFGGAPTHTFTVSKVDKADADALNVSCGDKKLQAKLDSGKLYTLYYHMTLFFANGGAICYVVSVGNYNQTFAEVYSKTKEEVFANIKKEQDITILVVPEAVNNQTCMSVYTGLLGLCDSKRFFAILDIPEKFPDSTEGKDNVEKFRTAIGTANLQYAAVYHPWLETSVLSDKDINEDILLSYKDSKIEDICGDEKLKKYVKTCLQELPETPKENSGKQEIATKMEVAKQTRKELHNALLQNLPEYRLLAKKVKDYLNLLPPSAAMAGIYTMVDNTRGVWKAPANVSVNYVNKPSVIINDKEQEEYNMPINGKAINVIRAFPGEGVKVWGARTLDGNSNDWRYINVRRTMSFLEVSVKNAARAYVFEPNDAGTWINMKCMIENFLRSVWKRGGLAGATPEDAFEVHVGLGDTMTAEDILEGIMRITVLVAISHPAEFIEITFQQQMQKS